MKTSPELSEAVRSGTWMARVLSAVVPRTWNRRVPSVSYLSLSPTFLKPEAYKSNHQQQDNTQDCATYMASLMDHHLALEEKVEVVRLLVLHNAHLNGRTSVLVVEGLGPKSRGALLVLHASDHQSAKSTN
jgi:hypothetical protein